MRISSVKGSQYIDRLAKNRRRSFMLRIGLVSVGLVLCFVAMFYVVVFSGWFDVNYFQIIGAKNINPDTIKENLNTYRDYKLLNFIPVGRSIFFFDINKAKDNLLQELDLLKEISIKKNYNHALLVTIVERDALGIWCFENYVGDRKCKYFDEDMRVWGDVDKTTGFVLLTVEDYKTVDKQEIDIDYFNGIKLILASFEGRIPIKTIVIPSLSLKDFIVYTDKPYYLQFSLESGLDEQIAALMIFLDNQKNDTGFAPQYLDLRVVGRVYYK